MLTSEQANLVMRAYWHTNVDLPGNDPQRAAYAADKLKDLIPAKSDPERALILGRVLDKELREQALAQNFCSLIIDHSIACTTAIRNVRELLAKPQEERRWQDGDQIWINIETTLSRAAAISKCLFPPNGDRRHQDRGRFLRRVLHVPEGYLDKVRRARNAIEHFDEHLDDALHGTRLSLID
jgi:hypothetical protein